MGGSSKKSQTVGYKYFAKWAMVLGYRIDMLLGINFDKRKWFCVPRTANGKSSDTFSISAPSLYGEEEGGVEGTISMYNGTDDQPLNADYASYLQSLNYSPTRLPYMSYLVFSGGGSSGFLGGFGFSGISTGKGFYVGNSPFMKEMTLWPCRVDYRNDGRQQWYKAKSAIVQRAKYGTPEYILDNLSWVMTDPRIVIDKTETVNILNDDGRTYNLKIHVEALVELRQVVGGTAVAPPYVYKGGSYGDQYVFNMYELHIDNPPQVYRFNHGVSSGELAQYEADFTVQVKQGSKIRSYVNSVDGNMVGTEQHVNFRASNSGIIPKDMNIVHKIREILTDDTALGYPESRINDANFIAAADKMFADNLGISWAVSEKSCKDAIDELCYHGECGLRINRQTGLFEIVMFRDDWFPNQSMITFNKSNISRKSLKIKYLNYDDPKNAVNVKYYDREQMKDVAFSIHNKGSIRTIGFANFESVDFPYFNYREAAEKVAQWKLKQLSTPAYSGSFSTSDYAARSINRYDIVLLDWPDKKIYNIPVRVMNIDLGNGNDSTVSIEFIQVVNFSNVSFPTVSIDPTMPSSDELVSPNFKLFELPYYMGVLFFGSDSVNSSLSSNPLASYLGVVGSKTSEKSPKGSIYVDDGSGYNKLTNMPYATRIKISQDISKTINSFAITLLEVEELQNYSFILIGNELMCIQGYVASTGVVTVKRGVLDTVPAAFSTGEVGYIFDDLIGLVETEYLATELLKVRVTTDLMATGQSFDTATEQTLTMVGRAIKPYPPANVKINNAYYPTSVTGSFVVTWAHRNRLQQTGSGSAIVGFYDSSVTPRNNTRYAITVKDSVGNVLISKSSIGTPTATIDLNYTGTIEISMSTTDDDGTSMYQFVHSLAYTKGSASSNSVAADTYIPKYDGVIIDGGTV